MAPVGSWSRAVGPLRTSRTFEESASAVERVTEPATQGLHPATGPAHRAGRDHERSELGSTGGAVERCALREPAAQQCTLLIRHTGFVARWHVFRSTTRVRIVSACARMLSSASNVIPLGARRNTSSVGVFEWQETQRRSMTPLTAVKADAVPPSVRPAQPRRRGQVDGHRPARPPPAAATSRRAGRGRGRAPI